MPERVVVVGGDAGGMAAVSQVRKRRPNIDIVAFEKGSWTSYSACGIPYVVSGRIGAVEDLVARSPQQFRDKDRIDVRMRHEVMAIDVDAQEVEVRAHDLNRTIRMGYDQLLIGTGGVPNRPPLPGIDLPMVHGVQHLGDAEHLLRHAQEIGASRVVIVGGGYIGLEMAEAFRARGARTTLVTNGPQVLGLLDPDMADLVADALVRHGVEVLLNQPVEGFEPEYVLTGKGRIRADLVVLGLGVRPNSTLAGTAGIELGVQDAIRVDRQQRTSAANVWAAGDCCESWHLVSRQPVHVPLGTIANRQARVAGINIGGGYATTPPIVGTAVTRICDTEIGRTGLSSDEARSAGFTFVSKSIRATTIAGYLRDAEQITVKMLAEKRTGRVLGAQIVGGQGSAKRVDVVATAITAGMTVEDLVDLDLGYAPPFSPLWDPVAVAAREMLKLV